MSDKLVRICNRVDTASNWSTNNPILKNGEIGYDNTNNIMKVGNGTDKWNRLSEVRNYNSTYINLIYTVGSSSTDYYSHRSYLTDELIFKTVFIEAYVYNDASYDFSTCFNDPVYKTMPTCMQNTAYHYNETEWHEDLYLYPYFATDANISKDDLKTIRIGVEKSENELYRLYLDVTKDSTIYNFENYYFYDGDEKHGSGIYSESTLKEFGVDFSTLTKNGTYYSNNGIGILVKANIIN